MKGSYINIALVHVTVKVQEIVQHCVVYYFGVYVTLDKKKKNDMFKSRVNTLC